MTYSGRKVLADVADNSGWDRIEAGPDPHIDGTELVVYTRGGTRVLVLWTPENTAVSIIKETVRDGKLTGSVVAEGPTGLLTARGWIESAA